MAQASFEPSPSSAGNNEKLRFILYSSTGIQRSIRTVRLYEGDVVPYRSKTEEDTDSPHGVEKRPMFEDRNIGMQ